MRAKDLVDARYADPITVDDLAAAAGLSRAHFSHMFTRTFGESPRAYLQSVGSFTTTFARVYGRTPAAYRAAMPPALTRARIPSCVLARDTRPLADTRVAALLPTEPDTRVKTAHGEKTGADDRP